MKDALRIIKNDLGDNAVILSTKKVESVAGHTTLEITAAIDEKAPVFEAPEAPTSSEKPLPPPSSLSEALSRHGVAAELVDKMVNAADALADTGFNHTDTLEMVLGKLLTLSSERDAMPKGSAHVFIGPTGAGKTTTITKLAVEKRTGGASVGLISLDSHKIGGFAPLDVLADILEDQAHLIRETDDLKTAAKKLGKRNYVFIDTPGLNPYDKNAISDLKQRLNDLNLNPKVHLVLPIPYNALELPRLPVAYAAFQPHSIIFTKMDETVHLGGMINVAVTSGLPVCYATDDPTPLTSPIPLDATTLARKLATTPRLPWENEV